MSEIDYKTQYRWALNAAIKRRDDLTAQAEEVERELAEVNRVIASTSAALGEQADLGIGLTDGIRSVLRAAAPQPLTPVQVRQHLEEIGFHVNEYANILSSIHVVLKRLVASDEIEEGTEVFFGDSKGYRWKKKSLGQALAAPGFSTDMRRKINTETIRALANKESNPLFPVRKKK